MEDCVDVGALPDAMAAQQRGDGFQRSTAMSTTFVSRTASSAPVPTQNTSSSATSSFSAEPFKVAEHKLGPELPLSLSCSASG